MGITAGKAGVDITSMSEKDKLKLRKSIAKLVTDEVVRARIIGNIDLVAPMLDDPVVNSAMRERLKSERWPVQEKPAEIIETDVVKKFGK
jgi:hypothetical protein